MASKTYTAEAIRHTAENLEWNRTHGMEAIKIASEHVIDQLRYAADIKERGDEALTALDAMQDNTEHLDIETVKDIVKHIIFGAQGSQSNAEKDGAK